MTLRDAFAPWRKWYLSAAEIQQRIAQLDRLLQAGQVDEGVRLAEETLVNDPYNPALHRALLRVHAARGDIERYGAHLGIGFSIHDLDEANLRADPELCGRLTAEQLDRAVAEARRAAGGDRPRDFCFDEVAPRARTFTTTLTWRAEHQEQVRAAYARFARLSARTQKRYVFPDDEDREEVVAEWYGHHVGVGTMALETESMPGAFCPMGVTLGFVRDVAPHVDDVRFFFYDQVSPLDEVWIVDHGFYIRRHPVSVDDFADAVRYLDDQLQREQIADAALGAYVAQQASAMAEGRIANIGSPPMDAAQMRREAEELMARAARYDGEEPPYLRAELHRCDGNVAGRIASLERTVERTPDFRKARLELAHLYFDDGRAEDALAVLDRVIAQGDRADEDTHLLRGQALELLDRREEALEAYRRHAHATCSYSGVLLSQANALLADRQPEGARLLYQAIVSAAGATGIDAELGLARCADALGDRDVALDHYRRVLARAEELERRNTESAGARAQLERVKRDAQERLAALRAG
jgi:tetratricopeptide (TPR) repeat protein